MDNLCHTLAGAALSHAGFNRRTRHATLTLAVAANLPDIDVLVFFTSIPSVGFRRGWTHGVLAQLLLPILLTAIVAGTARRHPPGRQPVSVPWLLAASFAGVLSHALLDFLNNYGVRLLAPFDWRWFYGDAVFIIDPWLWLALGAGTWWSWRRRRTQPARVALTAAAVYVCVMLVSARAARGIVATAWEESRGRAPQALMVGPLPVTPFLRQVIVDAGDHYESGTFSWWSRRVTFDGEHVPKGGGSRAVETARRGALVQAYLSWSRFPYWRLSPMPSGTRVDLRDMRFNTALGNRLAVSTVVPKADPRR